MVEDTSNLSFHQLLGNSLPYSQTGDPFSVVSSMYCCISILCVCLCVCVCVLSHVQLLATPWTVAPQAPLSMGFSRQEYGSRLPFPFPRDLPNPGIKLNVSNSYHFTCCDSVDQQFGLRSAGCFLVWSHLRSLMFYGHPSAQMKLVSLSLIHMSGEWRWLSAGPCATSRPRGIFM